MKFGAVPLKLHTVYNSDEDHRIVQVVNMADEWFSPKEFHVEFVVDALALKQVSSEHLDFPQLIIITSILYTHLSPAQTPISQHVTSTVNSGPAFGWTQNEEVTLK
jgi:hypothetical protein